jgi:hypothetical protein
MKQFITDLITVLAIFAVPYALLIIGHGLGW